MDSTRRSLIARLTLVAALVPLSPPHALAQESTDPCGPVTVASEADAYEAWARGSLGRHQNWPYGARMLEKSASLREPCDARAVDALVLAGRIYHHLGRLELARLTLLEAADRALTADRPDRAADLYLDAGIIAVDQDYREGAVAAVLEAERLLASPGLTEFARWRLGRRLVDQRRHVAEVERRDGRPAPGGGTA